LNNRVDVVKESCEIPITDADPPMSLLAIPADTDTEPPEGPDPELIEIKPDCLPFEGLDDPTESKMLPEELLSESPVASNNDPVRPVKDVPDVTVASPVLLGESLELTTIDPLDLERLEPLINTTEPPTD